MDMPRCYPVAVNHPMSVSPQLQVQSVYRGHAARKRVEGLKSEKESQARFART